MSKRIYIPSLIIILFTSLVFFAPKLLDTDTVRSKVAALISAKSGWQIDAAQLDWYWLPTPHFSLHDTTLTKKNALWVLPETRIFPVWHSLLLNKIELREVRLINPELQIESFTQHDKSAEISLPQAKITIIDGSATFKKGAFAGQEHLFPLTIPEIDATIDLTSGQSKFQLSSKSPLFNFLELDGSFSSTDLGFTMDYEINGLQFHKLLPVLGDGRLLPVEAAISLRGSISGNGTEQFEASLEGDFPCFVAPSDNEAFLLDCGYANLDIKNDAGGLTININELQLKNPKLLLSGKIARLTDKNPDKKTGPIWLVDLTGKNLDLSAIRKGVLTLWGDNHITQTVCNIVLGGTAKQATYFFKAPLAGFKSIQQMKITVDIDEAKIHPPSTPLFLEKVSGQISINDGYLSGQGLVAKSGKSSGDNCSLFLDLAKRGKDFKLDLNIDAELADLPDVLYELVPNKKFRRELLRFSNIKGRANGRLTIGGNLETPKVHITINSVNGEAKYEPIPHPIRIRSGSINIAPKNINWSGIRGIVGPHMIREITGEISWDKKMSLLIKSAQASFDSAALLSDLKGATTLSEAISKVIVKAEGITELNKATLSGLISEPDKWQYSLDISTAGSRWTSPLLPHSTLAERVRARISQEKIDLISGKIWFLEQPLLIEGSFSHNNFTEWKAWSMFSGTIREPLAEWIREKEWIPNKYFPVIPCTLDKLKVQWDSDSLKLSGGIAAGMGGITSPSVRLHLESDKNRLKINKLVVSSPEEQGHLTLDYLKNGTNRLNASWRGFINSETVLELLNENILHTERVEGDFSVKYSGKPKEKSFLGWAKTRNTTWFFNKKRRNFMINNLNIVGSQDGSIKINSAVISNKEEQLNFNGQLTMNPKEITFDLGLDAAEIKRQTANIIIKDIKNFSFEDKKSKAHPDSFLAKTLKGIMHFKTERFTSNPDDSQDDEAALSSFSLSPANGFITIDSSADQYSLDLRDSNICDLAISGTLNSKESNHESSLTIFTDSSSPPQFKNVLPCFGFKNAIIDGAVHLDVNLKGMANEWYGGTADLYSDGGYIHRLGFLSKVFRVINLRDIFSGTDMPDFANKGFAFTKVEITSHVKDNKLYIDKAFIDGEGLNIFGQGTIDLADWSADLIIMLAPLKSVDAVIINIPFIGKVIGGKDKAVISIPVALKGDLRDPDVTILPPEAIGVGFLNLVANTFMMPFRILSPLLPDDTGQ